MGDGNIESSDSLPPRKALDRLNDAENVTGAEFLPPGDLNGYLDEPKLAFGLWVGESEEEADLHGFEIEGDQIHGLAEAFQQASEKARELEGCDGE